MRHYNLLAVWLELYVGVYHSWASLSAAYTHRIWPVLGAQLVSPPLVCRSMRRNALRLRERRSPPLWTKCSRSLSVSADAGRRWCPLSWRFRSARRSYTNRIRSHSTAVRQGTLWANVRVSGVDCSFLFQQLWKLNIYHINNKNKLGNKIKSDTRKQQHRKLYAHRPSNMWSDSFSTRAIFAASQNLTKPYRSDSPVWLLNITSQSQTRPYCWK